MRKKVHFFCGKGLTSFITPVISQISGMFDTKLVEVSEGKRLAEDIQEADVIFIEWANELAVALTQQWKDVLKNKTVIIRLHSYEALGGYVQFINWNVVDHLIFVAPHVRDVSMALISVMKDKNDPNAPIKNFPIHVVPNGVNMKEFPLTEAVRPNDIVFLGSISHKKGITLLVEAIKAINKNHPKYDFHIGGDFQDMRYKFYINETLRTLIDRGKVTIYGRIDNPVPFLNGVKAILCTSPWEGHPVGIMEAMAMGVRPLIHDFYGAGAMYPSDFLWSDIPSLLKMLKDKGRPRMNYRRFLENKFWTLDNAADNIAAIIHGEQKSPGEVETQDITASHSKLENQKKKMSQDSDGPHDLATMNKEEARKETQEHIIKHKSDIIDVKTKAAINFLKNISIEAQDGSMAVQVSDKNKNPYPEVTGYLIPTLLRYNEKEIAGKYTRWLVSNQNPNGSWPESGSPNENPFDVGQCIRGLTAMYMADENKRGLKDMIKRAVNWIVNHSNDFDGIPIPVSWNEVHPMTMLYAIAAVREAAQVFGYNEWKEWAVNKFEYYIDYYVDNYGMFIFDSNKMNSHFYFYIIEAILDFKYADEMTENAIFALEKFEEKYLTDNDVVPASDKDRTSCISTGQAQAAICYAKADMMKTAERLLRYMHVMQNPSGAFYGSYGPYCSYFRTEQPSWAVKFYLDACWIFDKKSQEHTENQEGDTSQLITENHKENTSQVNNQIQNKETSQNIDATQDRVMSQNKKETHSKNTNHGEDESHTINMNPSEWGKTLLRDIDDIGQLKVQVLSPSKWAEHIYNETKKGDHILEIGSGTGVISALLNSGGRYVYLQDFSKAMLLTAEDLFTSLGTEMSGSSETDVLDFWEWEDDMFDCVFSVGLLEHFDPDEIDHIMQEAKRVTKPDGKIIMLVPNADCIAYIKGKEEQEEKGIWKWGKERPFTKVDLIHYFKQSGLDVVHTETIDPEHALRFLAHNPEKQKALATWLKASPHHNLKNQGYLLSAIGKKKHDLEEDIIDTSQVKKEFIASHDVHEDHTAEANHNTIETQDSKVRVPLFKTPIGSQCTGFEIPSQSHNEGNVLVVVPNDPLNALENAGYENLEEYFNPGGFFDKVYCVNPWETTVGDYEKWGMIVKSCPTGIEPDKLAEKIGSLNPHLVHVYDIRSAFMCKELVSIKKHYLLPIICSIHDNNPERIPTWMDALPDFAHFTAVSEEAKRFTMGLGVPETNITVIPNGIDVNKFKRIDIIQFLSGKENNLLSVGRLSKAKNQITLLGALEFLEKSRYHATFIGRQEQGYIDFKEYAERGKESIKIIESVRNHDLVNYYNAADIFVLPSHNEGFGIVFAEAMACECIVITSDLPPMNEYIIDGFNGFLLDADRIDDPDFLASLIEEVSTMRFARLVKIGLQARETIVNKFSLNAVNKKRINLYKKVIKDYNK